MRVALSADPYIPFLPERCRGIDRMIAILVAGLTVFGAAERR